MCLAFLAVACSGGGTPGGEGAAGDGLGGSGTGVAGADAIGGGGNNPGGGAGGDLWGGGGTLGGGSCQPTTCEAQGKSCGKIVDGCGSVIDCGGCGDDEVCGLAEANVCAGIEDVCVRVSQEVACEGKACGVEGDGCGGIYDCGTCPDGQACGLVAAYQCATIPGGTPTDCAARITSCAEVGASCGVIGNGCGGTIDCDAETGGCGAGELCGVDPEQPLQCAEYETCVPLTPEVACASVECGLVTNGCGEEVGGGIIDCEAAGFGCTGDDTCGGAGVPYACGQATDATCTPVAKEVACGSRVCGFVADGCGFAWDCSSGAGCGAGNQCKDGQCEAIVPGCTRLGEDAACAGKECGTVGDNCGGTYTCGDDGGGCPGDQTCGAISAYQCDFAPGDGCNERSQVEACAGKECGIAYDGCGTDPENTYDCGPNGGACPSGELCGAQAAYRCDPLPTPTCVPNGQDCDSENWACGTFVDNCGNEDTCGTCASNQTCMGGIGEPTRCVSVAGNGDDGCPLCNAVPTTCASNQLTRLTGRVISPGQADGNAANQVRVPNAFVYILRTNVTADLPDIGAGLPDDDDGLSCDRCDDQDLGAVLVGDVTDANGDWELEGNIPVDQEFLLVTKVGKFRRAQRLTLPAGAACTTTNLPTTMSTAGGETAGQGADDNPTRLPRSTGDGLAVNIPRMAITTGRIDAMECVFYKMGIAQSEFGNFSVSGTHRIDLYRGGSPSGSAEGARIDGSTPRDLVLYDDLSRLEEYDMVVSDCEGGAWDSGFTQRGDGSDTSQGGKVRQYVNRGGRMFLSHLSFSWLHNNGATTYALASLPRDTGLGPSSTWFTSANTNQLGTGVISIVGSRPRVSPRIQTFADWMVNEDVTEAPGYTFSITDPRSQNDTIAAGTEEFVYRADAPPETTDPTYNSASGNGRVQQFSFNTPFGAPAEEACGRVAYSGFHVAATGGSSNPFQESIFPAHCTGNLTAQEKVLLFMLFDLGTCVGEEPEPPTCTPVACEDSQCGVVSDGCGGTQDCEGCANGQICDDNICRVPCVPTSCAAEGVACSTIADGCGDVIECPCSACVPDDEEEVCTGDKCGYHSNGCSGVVFCGDCPNSCVPEDECPAGVECGVVGDGCNSTIDCGSCPDSELCGAVDPNVCDPPSCRPLECYEIEGVECGLVGDGCGGTIPCGTCPPGQICTVVDGQPNRCAGCEAKTQEDACAGLECGLVGDGCGGTLNCGTCPSGQYCGSLSPNMCDPGPQCTPGACPSGAECGVVGDGCGSSVSCGTCPAGQLCGVFEPYKCGGCTPQTCTSVGAQCGKIGDGCGNELDCGECAPSFICGLGEANKCAQLR